ncbi:TetR/AcrR family transcriptional regulator [Isoptericola halotolerans]|uniref:TetR/AcrR family transcriptional regulator n=1 Tax=Isoptericola halotolerans TaxID=300560 RepID=UPI00388DCF36
MNAPTSDGLGLRARKKRARADAIVDAAQRLVLAHGFDAVTVEAIAEAAGISPRTFFNYFESKDDAVLGQGSFDLDAGFRGEFVAGGPTGRLTADLEILATALLGAVAGSAPDARTGRRGPWTGPGSPPWPWRPRASCSSPAGSRSPKAATTGPTAASSVSSC